MARDESKDPVQRLLKHVDISRRGFVRGLLGSTFTVPVIASFTMDGLTVGTSFAQTSNIPGSNLPWEIPGCNIPGSNLPGSNIPGSNIPSCIEILLRATGDATIRSDQRSVNEGANRRLRVGKWPLTRVAIEFDQDQLAAILGNSEFILQAARLFVTVETNHHNWSQSDDQTVDAHQLLERFIEGDGQQLGVSGAETMPATGAGVTWNSPDDPNVADRIPGSALALWHGGDFAPATAVGVVHTNTLDRGDCAMWDVTLDVMSGRAAWLLKLTDEQRSLRDRSDPCTDSTIEYYSREGARLAGNENLAPMLVITGTMLVR